LSGIFAPADNPPLYRLPTDKVYSEFFMELAMMLVSTAVSVMKTGL